MAARLELIATLAAGIIFGVAWRELCALRRLVRRPQTRALLAATAAASCSLLELPGELLARILSELSSQELTRAANICREFRDHIEHAVRLRALMLIGNISPPERSSLCWAQRTNAKISAAEALLEGKLVPGEYHFALRTTDEAGDAAYHAYGQLCLSPCGKCRGSAVELAPNGLSCAAAS